MGGEADTKCRRRRDGVLFVFRVQEPMGHAAVII